MSETDSHAGERGSILTRLLDAVKQCQVRFGGRSELATDADSRVSCLCAVWEAALQHGMRKNNKALMALRQMTERAGLGKVSDFFADIKNIETEPSFWQYVKEHLTKHELQRYINLKAVNSETGRGRAWLRAALNEHSLERYMHMLLEREDLQKQYYEDWAFLRDQERASMMPNMAAGLGSILFAITIDRAELNKPLQVSTPIHMSPASPPASVEEEPRPVIAEDRTPSEKKKERKKKKLVANVVSFDGEDNEGVVEGVETPDGGVASHRHRRSPATLQSSAQRQDSRGEDEDAFPPASASDAKTLQRGFSGASIASCNSDRLSRSSLGSFSSEEAESSGEVPSGLVPLTPAGLPIQPARQPSSDSHSDMSSYSNSRDDLESAAVGLALAQRGLVDSYRTDGDGKYVEDMNEFNKDTMTIDELKQAVVTMMLRKDEVEEQNRTLRGLLDQESENCATLRAEIAELKTSHTLALDQENAKGQALQKENELLKHQLKKYVNAVQLLRTEGADKDKLGIQLDDPQPSLPPPRPLIDYSHEASEYEKKLIQVAEMHGELMEFNELLHRQLNAREAAIRILRSELEQLRGPLPSTPDASPDSTDIEDMSLQTRALINIWIPSAFLQGSASSAHHVYQVYIRIRDEEWNVYRRYSQFLDLHSRLKKVYPIVGKFSFPPKKNVGKKDPRVVEQRRQMFQQYLRAVINLLLEKNEDLASNTCKEKLVAKLPFFGDKPEGEGKKQKGKQPARSRGAQDPTPGNGAMHSNAEYSGL